MPKFNHVGLVVTDLKRSVQFYQDVLGLRVLSEHPDTGRGLEIAFMGTDFPALEILRYADPAKCQLPGIGRFSHIAWQVEDIEQAVAAIKAKGVELQPDEIRNSFGGSRVAFFFGPDGERIELMQPARA